MNAHSLGIFLLVCLVGCSESNVSGDDFGARTVARFVVDAQARCTAAGFPELLDCSDAPLAKDGARVAARTAEYAYSEFRNSCYEALGSERCEGFMASAYAQATKAGPQPKRVAQAPSPAQSPAP